MARELIPFFSAIFEGLPEEALAELSEEALLVGYNEGDLVVQEGSPFSGVYIIYSGLVLIGKYSSSRKRRILRFLAPREFFGLEALFMKGQETNIQFARALLDSELVFIRAEPLLEFLQRCPLAMLTLCRWFAREVAMLEFKLTRDATEGSLHNLAMLLLALSNKYGHETPAGTIINLELPRALMAEMLGISEETLLKLLKRLKGQQIISVQDSKITILNKEKLDSLALTADFYLTILEETL
ncbi:MAG: Crp/Fnr family transcriptional regulator [Candidatus Bipolaricaulia bacterium]